jgi:hypothetical protein
MKASRRLVETKVMEQVGTTALKIYKKVNYSFDTLIGVKDTPDPCTLLLVTKG